MTKTIASIYFEPLSADRPLYNGYFRAPAVKKGDAPFLLQVKDHIQLESQPWFKGTFNGRQIQTPETIDGRQITVDLLKHWADDNPDFTPDCGPGVWLVRELVPADDENGPVLDANKQQVMREATAEEKKRMFAEDLETAKQRQYALIEKWIQKGDIMAEDPKRVMLIPAFFKDACRYAGRDRKWLHDLRDGDIKTCVFCTKTISSATVKCPHCNEVVDRKRYEELKKQTVAA
jgi:hypothetical protein